MFRFIKTVILMLTIIIVVPLAVANRHTVSIALNPFDPQDPRLTVPDVPLFWVFFACIMVGIVLGGVGVWTAQGRWRKEARVKRREADKWHKEADKLREMTAPAPGLPGGKGLPAPDKRSAA